ncbi:class I SAM-dependent methyltransferase [Shewanella sp. AC34-MNA-CIBAN-0136]|uniref:class I SAM-dependent methyltransferase n=1 Tax=Shewanella sp. AC34-MNA-CIBAN-0136 TaxID=3140463 RepID=UPI00331CD7E6
MVKVKTANRKSLFGGTLEDIIEYNWYISGVGELDVSFGLCRESGLVMQTRTVTPEEMTSYYEDVATYVSSSRNGNPTQAKVEDLNRLISLVKLSCDSFPSKVLQFGSSDGYTLSRFQASGSTKLLGIEPSELSRNFARSRYGITTLEGTIEEYDSIEKFNLIIATHILEHLYDPYKVLNHIRKNLTQDGWLLIEVPLWEKESMQPIGVLTFEHLNYFCEETLTRVIFNSGYDIVHISKNYNINHYPVITILAKVKSNDDLNYVSFVSGNYEKNKIMLLSYIKRESEFWRNKEQSIYNQIKSSMPTYIYGGGVHTSQLLSMTNVIKNINISNVIDESETKQGKMVFGIEIKPPSIILLIKTNSNIIISSRAFELDILKSIKETRSDLNIITLYQYGDVK